MGALGGVRRDISGERGREATLMAGCDDEGGGKAGRPYEGNGKAGRSTASDVEGGGKAGATREG